MTGVRFDIRRITLHGYSTAQRRQFLGALHTELTALAEQNEWPAPGASSVARIDAGTLAPGAGPEAAAARVAARIGSAIGPASAERRAARR